MKKLFLIFYLVSCTLAHAQVVKNNLSINTENTCMVFSVTTDDEVIYRYYGNKLRNLDAFSYELRKNPHQPFPALYPTFGGTTSINPALKLTHGDGIMTSELKFSGIRTIPVSSDVVETIIELKDKLYDINVSLHFKAYQKEDIITQYVTIKHHENKSIKIENIASGYLNLHADHYYLSHFAGAWANEMLLEEELLTHGIKSIESTKGVRTAQTENSSFLISIDKKADEYSGEVYAGALAWSGNYKLSFQVSETGNLDIVVGMNPFASSFILEPGEEIKTPEIIWSYSSIGKNRISQNFHNWSRRYALAHGNDLRPIVLNSWEGVYMNFDEKDILSLIDDAANFGVELFVLDDGWFGDKYPRDKADSGLGDWVVNKKKLPHGIGYLADYAVNKGVRFGIWIEPEMVNPRSVLAEKYPEWIVKTDKYTPYVERNQWLLDLSNPDVQHFVEETFDKVVSMSPNISYIKWDANRHANNVGSSYLPSDKQSHFWYEYTKGLYKVYEKIRAKYPDLLIQLCSSGGGRLDYGALKYHDEFWPSDNTNAVDRIYIQHGTSHFFPAIATASHISSSPNHQTGMSLPLKFRVDVAMSGRLGMELQPRDITGKEVDFVKQSIDTYKNIRPIIQHGDLFRLSSPYDSKKWASLMYVSPAKDRAVYFVYSLGYHVRNEFYCKSLKGLMPHKKYKVKELNKLNKSSCFADGKIFTGEYLMNVGIPFNISKPYESGVLLLEEVK